MPEILKTILVSLGSTAVLLSAVGWLCKSWLVERLKNAIAYEYAEKLKALEHGYAQQLEKLRAQLQSESFKAKEEMEHDRKIFAKLTSYCDETTFRDVCGTISDHGFYDYEGYKLVRHLEHYGIKDENQFVNPQLRAAFKEFHNRLAEFTTIVARNFFATGEHRFMIYPELKNSGNPEERKIFETARDETSNAGDRTLEAFSDFRQAVKQILFV